MYNKYPEDVFDELKLLARFSLESHLEGLKIHSQAGDRVNSAAERLFQKGFIDQSDGGYLTDSGRELAEHIHEILDTLSDIHP